MIQSYIHWLFNFTIQSNIRFWFSCQCLCGLRELHAFYVCMCVLVLPACMGTRVCLCVSLCMSVCACFSGCVHACVSAHMYVHMFVCIWYLRHDIACGSGAGKKSRIFVMCYDERHVLPWTCYMMRNMLCQEPAIWWWEIGWWETGSVKNMLHADERVK